ncbi:MAG: deoxyribodipyrimidine photolyase [Vicinamibacterales bacterium]
MELPESVRVRNINASAVRGSAGYVLYWMTAARRTTFNFGLDRAVAWAEALQRPLIVLEALRTDYPWASDRLHRFVLDGMRDQMTSFAQTPAHYFPYVEGQLGAGKGLLAALSDKACVVVTDDYPAFFHPRMLQAAARQVAVRLEAVDSNGLIPLRAARRAYPAAVHFRRHVQTQLRLSLRECPSAQPFAGRAVPVASEPPRDILARWPTASREMLEGSADVLRSLPIDHAVRPVGLPGGARAADDVLRRFIAQRLDSYHTRHNHPDDDGTSRLSPYLHFGHISTHAVFDSVMRRERWTVDRVGAPSGAREGWWGVSGGADAFLDQLIVWRELAFNTCVWKPEDYDRFESLPAWALDTLERHSRDPRPFLYSARDFEEGATHDSLWNAAQHQLREEGWMHNYLRMLWGKKILEWSATPQEALKTMSSVMNRWALDGRDPNSWAGYFWTLGRYDRPWPERAVFGTVRSMSTNSTRKKVHVKQLLGRYGSKRAENTPAQGRLLPDS